jgi:hypothetical protein
MRNVVTAIMPAIALLAAAGTAAIGADNEKTPLTPEQRMQARYPQPVRVGDLIGLPLLDDNHRTLGHVREVVRTKTDKIELIVDYSALLGFFGWDTRPIAVSIAVVCIRGRELASLDMPRSEYVSAPNWQANGAAEFPDNATIRVALCRGY